MKKITLICILLVSFTTHAFSQEGEKEEKCPQVSITTSPSVVNVGEVEVFTVNVSWDNEKEIQQIEYLWEVENGEIVDGQGTKTISVKKSGETTTATVELKELPRNCVSRFTEAGLACKLKPKPKLLD